MITTTRPTVICAWCSRTLVEGAQEVSHGICRSCVETHMPDAWADLMQEGGQAVVRLRPARSPRGGW